MEPCLFLFGWAITLIECRVILNGLHLNIHIDYVDSQIPSCEDNLCRDPEYPTEMCVS